MSSCKASPDSPAATRGSCFPDVSGRVTDGNGAHHLPMVQCVDLAGVARNPWAHQSIRRERYRLHLSVGRHVKRISTDERKEKGEEVKQGRRDERGRTGNRKNASGRMQPQQPQQQHSFGATCCAIQQRRPQLRLHWPDPHSSQLHGATYQMHPGMGRVRPGGSANLQLRRSGKARGEACPGARLDPGARVLMSVRLARTCGAFYHLHLFPTCGEGEHRVLLIEPGGQPNHRAERDGGQQDSSRGNPSSLIRHGEGWRKGGEDRRRGAQEEARQGWKECLKTKSFENTLRLI
ncbi:hypothetical protein EYF80_033872 [Liparis tanakae]|uniref:Uncharacterized protein n=1 Tax=Liparis tanakae TaxID=230148 RepID=A0A4Z2GR47_9TELE|nr:hypothetical protein EYF80_033872 [Liparis tanakae]